MSPRTRLLAINALRLALQDNAIRREVREECLAALEALLADKPDVEELLGRGG